MADRSQTEVPRSSKRMGNTSVAIGSKIQNRSRDRAEALCMDGETSLDRERPSDALLCFRQALHLFRLAGMRDRAVQMLFQMGRSQEAWNPSEWASRSTMAA